LLPYTTLFRSRSIGTNSTGAVAAQLDRSGTTTSKNNPATLATNLCRHKLSSVCLSGSINIYILQNKCQIMLTCSQTRKTHNIMKKCSFFYHGLLENLVQYECLSMRNKQGLTYWVLPHGVPHSEQK